jgi:hypothetical protein
MADLSITAANVAAANTASKTSGTAGATITAGQLLALDTATGTIKLCDCNSATASLRKPVGISLHAALAGQPIAYHTKGVITIGATVAIGVSYFASGTGGGLRPAADNTTGDYVSFVGIGISTTQINMRIVESGAAMA